MFHITYVEIDKIHIFFVAVRKLTRYGTIIEDCANNKIEIFASSWKLISPWKLTTVFIEGRKYI